MKNNNVNKGGGSNPYLDGLKAKVEADKAVSLLNGYFKGKLTQLGKKQLYKVNTPNPFFILITSAPSNLKLDKVVKALMKENGSLPFYIIFTRTLSDYPTNPKTVQAYYSKLRIINKSKGKFRGSIIGIEELTIQLDSMKKGVRIPLNIDRVKDAPSLLGLDSYIREKFGLTPKKSQSIIQTIKEHYNIK
jgi:hypothetical protein